MQALLKKLIHKKAHMSVRARTQVLHGCVHQVGRKVRT